MWGHTCGYMARGSTTTVAVVGAGFGGLVLARALQQAARGFDVVLLEQDESLGAVRVGGELRVPSAGCVLAAIGLEAEWDALHRRASQPDCLPLQGLRDALAASLQPAFFSPWSAGSWQSLACGLRPLLLFLRVLCHLASGRLRPGAQTADRRPQTLPAEANYLNCNNFIIDIVQQ